VAFQFYYFSVPSRKTREYPKSPAVGGPAPFGGFLRRSSVEIHSIFETLHTVRRIATSGHAVGDDSYPMAAGRVRVGVSVKYRALWLTAWVIGLHMLGLEIRSRNELYIHNPSEIRLKSAAK